MSNSEITKCEVCGSASLRDVLDLGPQPLCDDLVPIDSGLKAKFYETVIAFCDSCLTAHQRHQVPKVTLFPNSYHYRSRLTADVTTGMQQLVESVENYRGDLKGLKVVDIGCNDGSLLDIFHSKGAETLGVEPTNAAGDLNSNKHLIYQEFFDTQISERIVEEFGQPDIVTFTNVFAHIEDLEALLEALHVLMKKETVLVIENHYLGSVLSGGQFDTFYHEHPRTYSVKSLHTIAISLDRALVRVEFPKRYGGNVRVFVGKSKPDFEVAEFLENERWIGDDIGGLQSLVSKWSRRKTDELDSLVHAHGPLKAKAFPGRASILGNLLNLNEKVIEAIYEKPDSPKIGHSAPGMGIPILSDEEFFPLADKIPVMVNFAWHIRKEIESYMSSVGFRGRLVDIVDR